ncbi:MAG: gamma-glutamylcyclotransferase [Oscillospiraceae bacterium]|nr:gamma-glutamylcyclotransferase [Oscillospiraceae bacterium]
MKKRYYIAYGSNLNVYQMGRRCPGAKVIGTSVIPDYELLFKGSKTGAYLTIEKKTGSEVPVVAWEVTKEDELSLDHYEGCPQFYYKAEMVLPIKGILTAKTRERNCFVYIMHEDRPLGVPTSYYVYTCLDGYRRFGFDQEILIQAYANSRQEAVIWTKSR